jgi:transposase-like protein
VSSSKQFPEQDGSGPVDPAPRPVRRTFTAEYKAAIVAEYEAAPHGEKSAVLRREGLFHSHVQEWTGARAGRAMTTGAAAVSGSTTASRLSRAEREAERLRVENVRLNAKLAQTQAALVIMGKAHELLASLAESSDTPPSSTR